MIQGVCQRQGVESFLCPHQFAGDNGVQIAWTGLVDYITTPRYVHLGKSFINQSWRVDSIDVNWRISGPFIPFDCICILISLAHFLVLNTLNLNISLSVATTTLVITKPSVLTHFIEVSCISNIKESNFFDSVVRLPFVF